MDRLDNGRVFLQYESADGFSELISEMLYTDTMNTRKALLRCEQDDVVQGYVLLLFCMDRSDTGSIFLQYG